MPYRNRQHLLIGALMFAFASAAAAAETPAVALATLSPKESSRQSLDLRTPPITETMTPEQIRRVLSRTFEPRNIEAVEVDRTRLREPDSEEYIPPGFAALFWAAGQPSGFWRMFAPRLAQKSGDGFDPTNPTHPAYGIPAMAGELRPYDR